MVLCRFLGSVSINLGLHFLLRLGLRRLAAVLWTSILVVSGTWSCLEAVLQFLPSNMDLYSLQTVFFTSPLHVQRGAHTTSGCFLPFYSLNVWWKQSAWWTVTSAVTSYREGCRVTTQLWPPYKEFVGFSSGFLPQTKNRHVNLTGSPKLSLGVSVESKL